MTAASETAAGPAVLSTLLDRAQDAIAFERDRADAAEAMAADETERREHAEAELAALADRLGAAIRSAVGAERKRIRELADRSGAACTGDEGTSFYFSTLIEEVHGA